MRYSFIIILGFFFVTHADDSREKYYTYPTKDKWENIQDHSKRMNLHNIPELKLSGIPTEELLEICKNHPYFLDIIAFNTLEGGFKSHIAQFNGVRELLKREDLFSNLMKSYEKEKKKFELKESGVLGEQFLYTQLLLSRPEIVDKINNKEFILTLIRDFENFEASLTGEYYSVHQTAYAAICKNIIKADGSLNDIIASNPPKLGGKKEISISSKDFTKTLISILKKGAKVP